MTVTPNVLPKDANDWFNWIQSRIRVLERHRHGTTIGTSVSSDIIGSTASGWTVDTITLVQSMDVVQVSARFTRTGTTIASGASGDVGNTPICVLLPQYAPFVMSNGTTADIGALIGYYIGTDGTIGLATLAPNNPWTNGVQASFSGLWIVNPDT